MDSRIIELLAGCARNPGAPAGVVDKLDQTLGVELPADYLSLLFFSNGLEGFVGENYLMLYSVDSVLSLGVRDGAPQLVFIGSDGGGEGFAYDMRSQGPPIVNVSFIGMNSDPVRVLGLSILEFLERLHAKGLFDD